LTGTWVGDWQSRRLPIRHVTSRPKGTAKHYGTIDPGPNAARIGSVIVDVSTWTIKINADRTNVNAHIVVDGRLAEIGSANRKMSGTWSEGSGTGPVTLARVDSLSVSSGASGLTSDVSYDGARRVTLRGRVTHVDWSNPRAFLYVNVRDQAGATTNWRIEFGNPIDPRTLGLETQHSVPATRSPARAPAAANRQGDGPRRMRLLHPCCQTQASACTSRSRRHPSHRRTRSTLAGWTGATRTRSWREGILGPAAPNAAIEKTAIAVAMPPGEGCVRISPDHQITR
jgi:hypothetical protein